MIIQEKENSLLNPNKNHNDFYFEKRHDLVNLMRNINSKLDFNSQTFFLCVTYMDEVFNSNFESNNMNDYVLIALSCLFVAAKFNENDPRVPDIYQFNDVLSSLTKYKFIFSVDEIRRGEVIVLKMLGYKLNRYSIYHFIVFFFAHGLFFNETFDRSDNKGIGKKKALEKIYILSRELLDNVIEDKNEQIFINEKNNYLWAVKILVKSIEVILNIELSANENIFRMVYGIDLVENDQYLMDMSQNIKDYIEKIYSLKITKKIKNVNGGASNTNSQTKILIKVPSSNNETINKIESMNTPIKTPILTKEKTEPSLLSSNNTNRIYQHINYSRVNQKPIDLISKYKTSSLFSTSTISAVSNPKSDIIDPNFTKIKSDFSSSRKELYSFAMRKRACSSNKDKTLTTNTNSPVNTTHIDDSRYEYQPHTYQPSTNNNEMLYQKYISKRPSIKNIRMKNDSMFKQLYQDDILDKTKKIFDQAKKETNIETFPSYDINSGIHLRNKNNLYSNYSEIYGNTIIINNNININAYIDRKDTLNINKSIRGDKYVSTNGGRLGRFGTYYNYGYDQ